MKIVILGAGRIGGSLARNLSKSNYQVSIVDENKNRLSDLEDKLDIMSVEGNASSITTLKKSVPTIIQNIIHKYTVLLCQTILFIV